MFSNWLNVTNKSLSNVGQPILCCTSTFQEVVPLPFSIPVVNTVVCYSKSFLNPNCCHIWRNLKNHKNNIGLNIMATIRLNPGLRSRLKHNVGIRNTPRILNNVKNNTDVFFGLRPNKERMCSDIK